MNDKTATGGWRGVEQSSTEGSEAAPSATCGTHERAVERFVTNWLWEVFEEQCPTPRKCERPQMPSGCYECGWNSRKVLEKSINAKHFVSKGR